MFSGGILALTKRGIALSLWFAKKINLSTCFCKSKILLRSVFNNNNNIIIIIIIIIIVFIHTDKYTYPMLHFVKIDNYDNTKNN